MDWGYEKTLWERNIRIPHHNCYPERCFRCNKKTLCSSSRKWSSHLMRRCFYNIFCTHRPTTISNYSWLSFIYSPMRTHLFLKQTHWEIRFTRITKPASGYAACVLFHPQSEARLHASKTPDGVAELMIIHWGISLPCSLNHYSRDSTGIAFLQHSGLGRVSSPHRTWLSSIFACQMLLNQRQKNKHY